MTEPEYKYLQFEHELHRDNEETAIDYLAVESRLFERIQSCDRIGFLSLLKADVIQACDFFDTVEKNLTTKISNYLEYDEPIDECVRYSQDMTQAQWDRLELKLDEKIHQVQNLSFWEISTKASVEEPSLGHWETIEDKLFSRISGVERKDSWELCTKTDEEIIPGDAERAEQLFERCLDALPASPWEQVLKSEVILPYRMWEEHEEKLFSRIENHIETPKQLFWYIIENYVLTLRTAGVLALLLLFVIGGFSGYLFLNSNPQQISSIVYQMRGEAALRSELSGIHDRSFSSVDGGSVTFVNDHGVVSLQNEISVELKNVSRKVAQYSVKFNDDNSPNRKKTGNVAFIVNKNQERKAFTVVTPDYDIIVKGTYFKVEPDKFGRVSTRVLEGVVKIHSKEFGDTLLSAGQIMLYDFLNNRYTIQGNGPVIQRDEIESAPPPQELSGYRIFTVKADIDDAELEIDGKAYGNIPLTIRQPVGQHTISVKRAGFADVDTTINILPDDGFVVLDLQLQKIKSASGSVAVAIAGSISAKSELPAQKEKGTTPRVPTADQPVGTDFTIQSEVSENYVKAQKAELTGNWQVALKLYHEVFESSGSSKLRKEDALFSIGKLHAENESDATQARQVFLKYLALYPDGSFSGECWLRLAELEFGTSPQSSIQYYNRFFEMFPLHPRLSELQNRVGVIYLQSKNYKEAVAMFRLALLNSNSSRNDDRKQIYSNLYKALEESGDTKAAETIKKEQLAKFR